MLLRRLPGLACKYKYVSLFIIFVLVLVTYSLFSWGLICTNLEPWAHLNQMCNEFKKREAFGDLCHALCSKNGVQSLSCHAFHAGKETVFSAELQGDTKVVVKSSNKFGDPPEVFHWVDPEGMEHYPTEEQFLNMITNLVKSRLNVTIDSKESKKLSHFAGGQTSSDTNSELRFMEMREVWSLLQNQEYLISMVHSQKEIFPEVIGSCGQYFITEYLTPALDNSLDTIRLDSLTFESWALRVHLAVSILELIDLLDQENILLCDVKPIHFGTNKNGKLKILDLDFAFHKPYADSLISNQNPCQTDQDCSFFDCKSICNEMTKICDSPIVSTNLQLVCEKVFLGWTVRGRLIQPGLLMTSHTPQSLTSLLRQCSYSNSDSQENAEVVKNIAQRLINTLTELDNSLEGFRS